MNAIGGYFGFENENKIGRYYHTTPYQLDCGRSALEIIIETTKPKKIFVPYYTCDALLEPLIKHHIEYSFYAINEALEIAGEIVPAKKEYIIYINFFGLKNQYSKQLVKKYGQSVILDNTMAFFFKQNVPHWSFNSCRKFFGVVDGAYLQSPVALKKKLLPAAINPHLNTNFLFLRNEGLVEEGYKHFVKNESCFGKEVYSMSRFSKGILNHLNYRSIQQRRNNNFTFLHKYLKSTNIMQPALLLEDDAMFYPYLPKQKLLHINFWDKEIFIPRLWQDCIQREKGYEWEKKLSADLFPIPIDHRYDERDLKKIIKFIL